MSERIHISIPDNYSYAAVVDSHGWRSLAPFRYDPQTLTLERTHRLESGRVLVLTIRDGVEVTVDEDLSPAERDEVTAVVRRILALDDEMGPFYEAIESVTRLSWVPGAGAGRMMLSPTVWEDLVKTLFTTNVAWGNTVNMTERLVNHYGDAAADGSHTFPTPGQVAGVPMEELSANIRAGYRVKSLLLLAQAIEAGTVDVEAWRDPELDSETVYKNITKLHGFGAYAAGSMMRLLGHHDRLGLDSVARTMFNGYHNQGEAAPDALIEAFYEPYGRWRGLVMWMDILSWDWDEE